MAEPLVYVTVLFWQVAELALVERCVKSLVEQHGAGSGFKLRVLVIDNGCGATPRLEFNARVTLELLRLPQNRGFTGGHNAGMLEAVKRGADYVFLLNSDAVADPACVRQLLDASEHDASAGILGPLIVSEADPSRVESNGQRFSPRTARHVEIDRGLAVDAVSELPHEADAVSGCALLVRRELLERLGPLEEDLFFYFEDMEWCLRARRAGFKVLVVPRARVVHRGHGSTGGVSPLSTYYSVRNHMVLAGRVGGRVRGPLLKPLVLCYHLGFLARSRPRRTLPHFLALAQGAWAASTGHMGSRRVRAGRP